MSNQEEDKQWTIITAQMFSVSYKVINPHNYDLLEKDEDMVALKGDKHIKERVEYYLHAMNFSGTYAEIIKEYNSVRDFFRILHKKRNRSSTDSFPYFVVFLYGMETDRSHLFAESPNNKLNLDTSLLGPVIKQIYKGKAIKSGLFKELKIV